jgi:hypothetical protein
MFIIYLWYTFPLTYVHANPYIGYVMLLSFYYLLRLVTPIENFTPPAYVLLSFLFFNSVGTVICLPTLNFVVLVTCRFNILFIVPYSDVIPPLK